MLWSSRVSDFRVIKLSSNSDGIKCVLFEVSKLSHWLVFIGRESGKWIGAILSDARDRASLSASQTTPCSTTIKSRHGYCYSGTHIFGNHAFGLLLTWGVEEQFRLEDIMSGTRYGRRCLELVLTNSKARSTCSAVNPVPLLST